MTEKTAVLAPIPSASVNSMVAVIAGCFRSILIA